MSEYPVLEGYLMFDKDMVCHYTSTDKAISILDSKRINFSPFVSCDDPRESKQWNFDFIGGEQRLCMDSFGEAPRAFDNMIKNKSMILCFCGWNDEDMNFNKNAIPIYRQDYYRVGWARSRMWSQYGGEHSGVCLVFDRKKLEEKFKTIFETNKIFFGKVEYQYHLESFVIARKLECRNMLQYGVEKTFEMQIDKYFHDYFFLKLMDYRDEHEYRLVVIANVGDSITLPIESSLKGVIVGIDFPRENYELIDELAQRCSKLVERHFLSWQEGRPQLWNLWEVIKKST